MLCKCNLFAFSISISLSISLFSSAVFAGWEKLPSTDFSLIAPPSESESRDEIDVLLALQAQRTQAECELGQKQISADFKSLFGDSNLLTNHEFSTLEPLMKKVSHLGERISSYFKKYYRRTRPYNFDSRVQPCVTPPGGAKSYPSSHATVASLDSCVLAMLFPDYAVDFEDLGASLSERRLRVGVHFPSDVQAGRDLGNLICKSLQNEPDFVRDVAKLKKAL